MAGVDPEELDDALWVTREELLAIFAGTHPAITTRKNIETFKRQLQMFGFSYDWDREVATTHPEYYRWTQWIFTLLYKQGLAYEAEVAVNWCPALGTVLANEEVVDGKSEIGGHPVIRKPMKQWMLKITAYAERLLEDLDGLRAWGFRSRAMGYEGMGCVHPRQIPVIHEAFAPGEAEVARARKIVLAFEAAEREGLGETLNMANAIGSSIVALFVLVMSIVLWNAGLMSGLRRYGEFGVRLASLLTMARDPAAEIVAGPNIEMPAVPLTDDEVDALLVWIEALADEAP